MKSYQGALIDGKWSGKSSNGKDIAVINPGNGEPIGSVSACDKKEADLALVAAERAFPAWSKLGIDGRSKHILAFRETLVAHKKRIVDLLIQETGKVRGNAEYDFTMLTDCLQFHVEQVRRNNSTVFPSPDDSTLSYTRYSPVGVVVCVLTWNFPLLNLGYKLGPILASGCTCVIKPSEHTPLATSMALGLLEECGFPPGVVNVVNGTGLDLLHPLCSSKIPRLLTTIGSTRMGRRMIENSHSSIKRFSMELGGDAPVLIFSDVPDLQAVINDMVGLKYANAGQICVSPNRVYVQKEIYEDVVRLCKAKAGEYVYGTGDDHAPKEEVMQPMVSKDAVDRMASLVKDATDKGARIVHGGKAMTSQAGFYFEPTVLADVNDDMECQKGEIFGPILPLRSFSSVEEALQLANQSEYGLSAYIYTGSLSTALRAEQEIQCGNICINGAHYSIELPHGGLKQSGYGKDLTDLALRDYYDIKRVTFKR